MDPKELIKQLNQTWESMKSVMAEAKTKGQETAEQKSKIEKMETEMGALEQKIAAIQAKAAAPAAQPEETPEKQEAAAAKAKKDIFWKAMSKGIDSLNAEESKELKTMVLADENSLGYLAPAEFWADVMKTVVEISPIRQFASVRTITSREIQRPKRTTTLSASWIGETGLPTETKKKHGLDKYPAHKLGALAIVSRDSLEDVSLLQQDLMAEFSEQFALGEGTGFVSGNGVEKPFGFTTNADIEVISSEVANKLDFDDLLNLQYSLKEAYWPSAMFMANRLIVKHLRKLKDSDGQYIWRPAMDAASPSTILGYPYAMIPDMDSTVVTNKKVCVWGDFRRGYLIVDRRDLSVQILQELYAPNVGYLATKRVGGQVQQPEALKILKIS